MRIFWLKFFFFYLGCFSCSYLQTHFGTSPVLAAASVGLIGSFYHFSKPVQKEQIHGVIYAGCFAGMCAPEHLIAHKNILLVSLIGTLIYFSIKKHFNGFGGKLGTIAFISSLCLIFLKELW